MDDIVAAARTVPMMAPRRFVLVRGAERWDTAEGAASPLDRLTEYAAAPIDSTCLVIVGVEDRRTAQADARRQEARLSRALRSARRTGAARRGSPNASCRRATPSIATSRNCSRRSWGRICHRSTTRSSAFRSTRAWGLPSAKTRSARASLACARPTPGRSSTRWARGIWAGRSGRSPTRTIRASAGFLCSGRWRGPSASSPATRPPSSRVHRRTRQRRRAGVFQPYRARELAAKARAVRPREVERWLLVLAETDLALKSSRRNADAILEEMLTRLCRAETRGTARASDQGRPGAAP